MLRTILRGLARVQTVLAALALVVVVTPRSALRYGDNLQVALPLLAWACEGAAGRGREFFLRYAAMFTAAHGLKQGLGEAEINLRPSGRGEGFPSAHTSTAVLGASSLVHGCLGAAPLAQAVVIGAAAFVGASRIEGGRHDIWQVLAGAILGYGCDRGLRRPSPARRRAAAALGALAALATSAARAAARGLQPLRRAAAAVALGLIAGKSSGADLEFTLYGGVQGAGGSRVEGRDAALGEVSFAADWEGRALSFPPYWGLRATWWQPSDWGFGVEVNHAKVYASDATLARSGFSVLEMTDGLNLVTVNALRRFPGDGRLTPYVGAGLGVAVPHVEVTSPAGRVAEYQVTGPAVVWMAGVQWRLSDRWSLITEYKGSRSRHDADLFGGGQLSTDITTHALNLGAALRF